MNNADAIYIDNKKKEKAKEGVVQLMQIPSAKCQGAPGVGEVTCVGERKRVPFLEATEISQRPYYLLSYRAFLLPTLC
jgi:hypothetical protein